MPVSNMDKIIPFYDAIQVHNGEYDSGDTDYSVTTLLNPPRVVHLNKRHVHKVDLFIEDLYHSWTGTAAHNYMEYCLNKSLKSDGTPKYKCEERLRVTIEDRKISGAYDILWIDKLSLWDMKNTSTWKIMFGDKNDWAAQQNMYRYLYWLEHKVLLKELNIIGSFRDWSRSNKMRSGSNYPRDPVARYMLPLWDVQKTYDFMVANVIKLKEHEDTPDDDLPLCTYEDMWSSPDKVAVKTTRLKKAVRVCASEAEAKKFRAEYLSRDNCKDKLSQMSLEYRPATRTRCDSWCPINKYCNQYHEYLTNLAKKGAKI